MVPEAASYLLAVVIKHLQIELPLALDLGCELVDFNKRIYRFHWCWLFTVFVKPKARDALTPNFRKRISLS